MRLQRFLSLAGIASRRRAESYIADGRVTINGKAADLGAKVRPGVDQVLMDGRPVMMEKRIYLALHKPEGYTTSLSDRHAEHLVSELVPKRFGRVFPVGRLDRESSGLLLLTNDGELAFRLTHPRFGVEKVYDVWVRGKPGTRHLERMREGIELEDGLSRANEVVRLKADPARSLLRVTLSEGKKREVRRLFRAIGHPVLELIRIRFANIGLEGLEPGQIRPLSHREVRELHELVRRPPNERGPHRATRPPLRSRIKSEVNPKRSWNRKIH